jgi:TPR repeat protein
MEDQQESHMFRFLRRSRTLSRFDSATYGWVEKRVDKVWFPPLFWAAMAGMAATIYQVVFASELQPAGILITALLGGLFGFWARSVRPSLSRAAERLERKATDGDPVACRRLAFLFLDGAPGLARSRECARKWFAAGAELGDRESMSRLAEMLEWGIGGEHDRDAAARWKRQAGW